MPPRSGAFSDSYSTVTNYRISTGKRACSTLRAAIEQRVSREFASDIFEPSKLLTPEEELEARRSGTEERPDRVRRNNSLTAKVLGVGVRRSVAGEDM